MKQKFVIIQLDIHCDRDDESVIPVYRIFINDELFCERTYYWTDQYLVENFQIAADSGKYIIRLDCCPKNKLSNLKLSNLRVKLGPARIIDSNTFEII